MHLRYPLRHRNRWRSTDLLERSLGEVRRSTQGIGRFSVLSELLRWVQTCIVHMIRSSMRYVSYVDRKPIARDLRKVYGAANAEDAERRLEQFDQQRGE